MGRPVHVSREGHGRSWAKLVMSAAVAAWQQRTERAGNKRRGHTVNYKGWHGGWRGRGRVVPVRNNENLTVSNSHVEAVQDCVRGTSAGGARSGTW
jgi:hypothetical protein